MQGWSPTPASPWTKITACVGAPGCAKSFLEPRQLAVQIADRGPRPTRLLHSVVANGVSGRPLSIMMSWWAVGDHRADAALRLLRQLR